jgi:hypothetical protein
VEVGRSAEKLVLVLEARLRALRGSFSGDSSMRKRPGPSVGVSRVHGLEGPPEESGDPSWILLREKGAGTTDSLALTTKGLDEDLKSISR